MEINLGDMVWPMCVLRCNEALTRLQPGEDLTITVGDPDVVNNVLLLIKSQPDFRSMKSFKSQESGCHRITVHRMEINQDGGAPPH
jgi:TusA-related sulfurtransferase